MSKAPTLPLIHPKGAASTAEPDSTDDSTNAPAASMAEDGEAQSAPDTGEARIATSTREELVRQAAYRRYTERGTSHGSEVQDWLEAEAEINQSILE